MRQPNLRPEFADTRSGYPRGSTRGNDGEEPPPGLLRGPERDSAPGEPLPPVCHGGAEVPEPGARAPSAETCRAHRCCLNR